MKFFLVICSFSFLFLGCSKKNPQKNEVILQNDSAIEVDVDLTKMSATMVYAEIFNLIIDADSYAGKKIRMKGFFNVLKNPNDNSTSFAVFIPDATACCQQGVEFKFDFGTDFPQQNDEIIVTGTYKVVYDENDIMRTFLQAEDVIFNK